MLSELIEKDGIDIVSVSERIRVYETSFKYSVKNAPSYDYFLNIIQYINKRDEIKIILQSENESVYSFRKSTENSYNAFINDLFDDEIVYANIKIDKKVESNHFSIYSYSDFVEDILSLSVKETMMAFSSLLKSSTNYLVFDVYSPITMFATKTMFFLPEEGNKKINTDFNRISRINACKEISYFYSFEQFELIPDDFKITINYTNNPLCEIFEKIKTILSICCIATSTTLNDNILKSVINGQQSLEYSCNIDELKDNNYLYTIYDWIYTDGNAIDKVAIARNVISLHCNHRPKIEIDKNVMSSIQLNYNLYLKDNVKEYLELKNKVGEFISETLSKTGEYANSLLDKFKSNLIAIFGFLFTAILVDIASENPVSSIFTSDIIVLLEVVLLGSIVYSLISNHQTKYEISKVYESYEQLKMNYKNVLSNDDILEVFKNDTLLNRMKEEIEKSRKHYLLLWIGLLILSIVLLEIFSTNPIFKRMFDIIVNCITKK